MLGLRQGAKKGMFTCFWVDVPSMGEATTAIWRFGRFGHRFGGRVILASIARGLVDSPERANNLADRYGWPELPPSMWANIMFVFVIYIFFFANILFDPSFIEI